MRILLIISALLTTLVLPAQTVFRFTVETPVSCVGPVAVSCDNILQAGDDARQLHLYAVTMDHTEEVAFQYDGSRLWFIPRCGITRYQLVREGRSRSAEPRMRIQDTGYSLVLLDGSRPVLSYRYAEMPPPPGVDTLYHRSAFIHPLYTPAGHVLTRVQPPDHYHHYGVWSAWTATRIGDREVDFWNLGKGQGRVRYAGLISKTEGTLFCSITVRQEHLFYDDRGQPHTALEETWTLRAWAGGDTGRIVDLVMRQHTPLPEGILFESYRYGGGIAFRATEAWTKYNSSLLTSKGTDRNRADGTRARWYRAEGGDKEKYGLVMMDHPANHAFPEPLRVWPRNANRGRGDLFVNICPVRETPWKLQRGDTITFTYRLWLYDGHCSRQKAEHLWEAFAHPPAIRKELADDRP